MQYVVQWKYKSSLGGPWQAGEVIELEEELAEAVNRDSVGVLLPAAEDVAPQVQAALARTNRMQISAQTHLTPDEGVMNTQNFGAVVNAEDSKNPKRRKAAGK